MGSADDHELCYNLGVQLGDRGDYEAEIAMYKKALAIKPDFGKAWCAVPRGSSRSRSAFSRGSALLRQRPRAAALSCGSALGS